jgi:hypothetical protein
MGTSVIQSPDARLLMLGAGVFLINEQDESGAPTYDRHFGNIGSGELTQTTTRITKRESMTRNRNVYLDLQKDQTFELRLVLDEWSVRNMGLYLRGDVTQTAAQVATPVVAAPFIAAAVLGATYMLPVYGPVSAVTLKVASTSLVVGTDYTINLETGMVTLLTSAVNVDDGDVVTWSGTPTAFPNGLTRIRAGTRKNVRGAITFIGDPQNGPRLLVRIWKATIRPDANAALISAPDATDTTPLTLVASVEADIVNHPDSPLFDQVIIG